MNRQFKRILDLVRRTGDRMVVTDPDGNEAFVVMGLDQYEELLGLGGGGDEHFHDHDHSHDHTPSGWNPEMDGDLVGIDEEEGLGAPLTQEAQEDLPHELKAAVEHDLAILDSWRKQNESESAASEQQKQSEDKEKNGPDEDRFYLEPIE